MKHKRWFGMGLALVMASTLQAHAAPGADEIMQKNFFSSKLKKLEKEVSMNLINNRGETRLRKIHAVSILRENGIDSNMLVRFVAPAEVRGTAFLKIEHLEGEDDQWVYLPALRKSRRLVSSNKKDSFLGSDFAYGDVLPPKVSLYRNSLIREESVDGIPCFVIESIPVDENVKRDYGYGKKINWIGKDHFHELKTEYYDLAGNLLKTQNVRDIILVDKENRRWVANYREMINHQSRHKTLFVADRHTTDVSVNNQTFSLRNLEKE
jgi:hypothetical protein